MAGKCKFAVEVLPGLYLGNHYASTALDWLTTHGIKAIVNVGAGKNKFEPSIIYHKIKIKDSTEVSIYPYLEEAVDFIQSNLKFGHVLVHCRGGFSRSPTVVISYLIKYHKMTYQESYDLVKSKRSCIQPNSSFINDLQKFQQNQ